MSSAPDPSDSFPIIEQHPPERRQRQTECVVLYSCCCCCCCCLHTIGGVIGAALAGNYRPEPETSPVATKKPSSQGLYWFSLLITIVLVWVGFLLYFINTGDYFTRLPISTSFLYVAALLVLVGPAWLLAAAAVMALSLALRPNLNSDHGYWTSLGRITLWSIVGSLIGVGVMVVLFFVIAGL